MTFLKTLATLSIFLSSLSVALGDLDFVDGRASAASLQQYGAAEATVSLLLTTLKPSEKILEKSVSFTDKDAAERIVTEHEMTISQISPTSYNVSLALSFEGWVGDVSYTVSVITMEADTGLHHSYAADGTHSVYGVVLFESDASGKKTIVSGDNARTVRYASYRSALGAARELKVAAHGPGRVRLSDMAVVVRDLVGDADSELLSAAGVTFGADAVYVAPNKYRVGSGKAVVTLEHGGIEVRGESFETQFIVEMGKTPAPPPVVSSSGDVAATSSADGKEVSFTLGMWNVEDVAGVSATVDGETFDGEVAGDGSGTVTFTGSRPAGGGVHAPTVSATLGDGSVVEAVVLGEVGVSFGGKAGAGRIAGRTAGLVAGIVGLAVAALACVAAAVAWRSRRAAEGAEKSFGSLGHASWADGGAPAAFSIQRDVYGRGSVSVDGSGADARRMDSELWRVV